MTQFQKVSPFEKDYLNADSYLDSVIILTDNSSKTFFTLNKKREKLNIITDLEKQNKLIDSLLYLNSLDQEALEKGMEEKSIEFVKKGAEVYQKI